VVRDPLVGGTLSTQRPEVGQFRGCTATLISSRHVLTAAHCLGFPDYANTALLPGDSFRMTEAGGGARQFPVEKIHSFAIYRYEKPRDGVTTDVALIRLTGEVPTSSAVPAPIASAFPSSGRATMFGFGCTNRNDTTVGIGPKQILSFNIGTPTRALCPGDSGGPAFLGEAGAGGALWGINSDYQGTGSWEAWPDLFADAPMLKVALERVMVGWTGSERLPGIDRPGLDLRTANASDAAACETACGSEPKCRAFSWSGGRCALKAGIPDWVPCNGCVSGVRPHPQGLEEGVDRAGPHYQETRDGPAACRELCAKDARCMAFSAAADRCQLKETVGAPRLEAARTSGVRRGFELGKDRPGQELRAFTLPFSSPQLCQAACAAESACKAWSYSPPTAAADPADCSLKNAVPSAVAKTGSVSGIKGEELR
jgi:hypothetical protein